MELFPAIDLSGGQVVRLTRGDYGQMEVYHNDPAQVARAFYQQGARFLHVVDLDGAKDGALSNYDAVAAIVRAAPLSVELGGGVRDQARLEGYLNLGVERVILGTAAVKDPPFLRAMAATHGARLVVGVDAREGKVAVDGWLTTTDVDGISFCRVLEDIGVTRVIYTDIDRDGAMAGTNLPLYETLAKACSLEIIASGGISSVAEISALSSMGVYGAIVGKALYNGALRLEDLLAAARGEVSP